MKPLMVSARICGSFYSQKSLEKLCCIFAACVLLFNPIRLSLLFNESETFGSRLFWKVCLVLWNCQITMTNIVSSLKSPLLCKLFLAHELYVQDISMKYGIKRGKLLKTVRIWSVVIVIFQVSVILFSTVFLVLNSFYVEWTPEMLLPFKPTSRYKQEIYVLLNFPSQFFINGVLIGSCAVYACISYSLWKEFSLLNDVIRSKLQKIESSSLIEDFRITHGNICNMVNIADEIFSLFLANVYATTVVIFCLAVYMGVYNEGDHNSITGVVMYLAYNGIVLLVVTLCAAKVNTEVSYLDKMLITSCIYIITSGIYKGYYEKYTAIY